MPTSRPVGRPRKISTRVQNEIVGALQSGATYEIACAYAGISYAAFNNWMSRGRKELDRWREAHENVLETLVWRMKTRHPKPKKTIPAPKKRGAKVKNDSQSSHLPAVKRLIPDKLPKEVIESLRIEPKEREYVQFFKAIQMANAVAAVGWLNIIDKSANNDPNWAAWMLMKRFPQEYGGQRSSSVEVKSSASAGAAPSSVQQETIIKIVYTDYESPIKFQEESVTPPAPDET